MADIQEKLMNQFEDELKKVDSLDEKMINAISDELKKENPNAERLAGMIQMKNEFIDK